MPIVRQQIINNISGRLLQIAPEFVFQLPDEQYTCQTSVARVEPWRLNSFRLDELPAIAWRDGITSITFEEYNRPIYHLKMGLVAYLARATVTSRARTLLQEMAAAVMSSPRCGGLARWTEIVRHDLNLIPAADVIAAARLDITIRYSPLAGSIEPITGLVDEDTWQTLMDETTGQTVTAEPAS
jgi:hypothetical protein